MPIVRDGEKFACKQCIQGHRVSGCNHIDRPLQHVNKKGRPVSQCPHCRGLRRSRQTHIKCDCGERRHSRNTSSESASLDEDGCKCKCFLGKKCICALKKEVPEAESTSILNTPSPQSQRDSPIRFLPPGRSESSLPRFGNTYQPQAYRANHSTHDFGMQLQTHRPYQLGRSRHNAQRSVDSLPLTSSSSSSTTQYQAPLRNPSYDHQFLNPEYSIQQLHVPQPPGGSFNDHINGEFPIQLDQTTIDKSLSPHNTKRYSMNDFSMLAGMSHHVSDQRLFPHSAGSEPQRYPFQEFSSHDFAFPGFGTTAAQNPTPQSVASTDFTFPALSRSSSGTTSEPGDGALVNPITNNSPQPVITIDPTWGMHNFDSSDKGNFEYTPASYHETPSEYASPFDDPNLPMYEMDNGGNNGVNPFSTEPPSGGVNEFPLPSQDYNQGEARNDFPTRGLPDRSARNFSSSPQSTLDMDFRFPNNEVSPNDGYSTTTPLKQG